MFHSISAFCNAGVDILGDSSFTRYVNTPVITITTTMLVILSGLGYPVWIDLAKNIKMTIQSRKTSGRKNDHKAESSEQDRLDNDAVPSYIGNSRILSVGTP